MTTTALPPGLLDEKALVSPGAAISARQMLEEEQWRLIEPFIDDLLERIHRLAVAALSAPVLLAAGRRKDPFSYTAIMQEWTLTIRALADTRGLSEYMTDSLRNSDIPMQMYERTRRLLKESRDEGWTDYRTKVALRRLLVPPRPGKGMSEEQASYRAKIRTMARTASTRTFNERQLRTLRKAGVEFVKWVTRRDAKVRPTHVAVDSKVVADGQDFIVGGYPMAYPGDPKGPAKETVNCRCVLISSTGTFGELLGLPVQTPVVFPMNYVMDAFGGTLLQTGELTAQDMLTIGKIPENLAAQEAGALQILMNPHTNGPLQYYLRHAPGYTPHVPALWSGDRGYLLTYPERYPVEAGMRTLADLFGSDAEPGEAPSVEALIHSIDAGIDRSRTTVPSIVYRGFVAWKDLTPGEEYLDRGYTATSPDFEVAKRFVEMRSGGQKEITGLLEAETYEGQPLIGVYKIPPGTPITLGDPTVKEFILPRDSHFRVIDINPPYILLELIP